MARMLRNVMVLCKPNDIYMRLLNGAIDPINDTNADKKNKFDINDTNRDTNDTNQPGNNVEKTTLILNAIRANPKVTYDEIMELTSLSRSTVYRILKTLQQLGTLKRNGSTRGVWEILH